MILNILCKNMRFIKFLRLDSEFVKIFRKLVDSENFFDYEIPQLSLLQYTQYVTNCCMCSKTNYFYHIAYVCSWIYLKKSSLESTGN